MGRNQGAIKMNNKQTDFLETLESYRNVMSAEEFWQVVEEFKNKMCEHSIPVMPPINEVYGYFKR